MFLAFLLHFAACDKAEELEQKAQTAQDVADAKSASAGDRADQAAREAQATADAVIADATADFSAMREAYRHKTTLALAELDRRVTVLEAKAAAAAGSEKTQRETSLKRIRSQRTAFSHDYHALGTATGASWDASVVRLDAQLAALEASINAA